MLYDKIVIVYYNVTCDCRKTSGCFKKQSCILNGSIENVKVNRLGFFFIDSHSRIVVELGTFVNQPHTSLNDTTLCIL